MSEADEAPRIDLSRLWPGSMDGTIDDQTADEIPVTIHQDGPMLWWIGSADAGDQDEIYKLLRQAWRFQRIAAYDGNRLSDPMVQFVTPPTGGKITAFGYYLQSTPEMQKVRIKVMVADARLRGQAQEELTGGVVAASPGLGGA